MNWKPIETAPENTKFLVKVYNGLCSGGWDFHKAVRIGDKFFNSETKKLIDSPNSWASVNL